MDKTVTAILSYFSIVLWVVAFVAGDKEGAKFWLNQSLVLNLIAIAITVIGWVPFLGTIISGIAGIEFLVIWIMGLICAIKGEEKRLPIIGDIEILK